MKRGSMVRSVSSLGLAALLVPAYVGGTAAWAGALPSAPVRESVAYHVSTSRTPERLRLRLRRDRNGLSRRLHAAMQHEFAGAWPEGRRGAVLGVPTIRIDRVTRTVRRLPHGGKTRVSSSEYSRDTVSRVHDGAAGRTGEAAYSEDSVARSRVDVSSEHRERVRPAR